MKSHYTRWKESWDKDGPDNSILDEADGEDRETLESDLISNLGQYEAIALARLGSAKAVPHIEHMRTKSRGIKKAAMSFALIRISGRTDHIEDITTVLCPPKLRSILNHIKLWNFFSWWNRIEAAYYLESCSDARAFDALEKAMSDPDFLVRYNAATVFSKNSKQQTDDRMIVDNTKDNDKSKIHFLAQLLRSRIWQETEQDVHGNTH